MYINTFKYTPADVDCKLCTEYVKKFGCTACGCPWMAERIEAGVVGYAEVVRQMFPPRQAPDGPPGTADPGFSRYALAG